MAACRKLLFLYELESHIWFSVAWVYGDHLCGGTLDWESGGGRLSAKDLSGKIILAVCAATLLLVLAYFKYFDFFLRYLNILFQHFHIGEMHSSHEILLPVGISFYILQSLGYVIDVYRKDIYAEKNFLKYALFVSFFPQLVAGPIERSRNLLRQLDSPAKLTWDNFRKGLLLIFYGLFCKVVIADRIAVIVETVYGDSETYCGLYILYAAFLFSFQIYCDFYGYSTMARGSAMLLGIELVDNFNAPYYARSVKEFWRRWHISLSSWLKDYLYIPLGGNRKGSVRKKCNLLAVFTVSGLWHGASFGFVTWGFLNGFYQIVGEYFLALRKKLRSVLCCLHLADTDGSRETFIARFLQTVTTFALITVTWIFFAAGGVSPAVTLLKQMFAVFNWQILFDGSLYGLGVDRPYTVVMFLAILLLMLVDYEKYHGKDVAGLILKHGWWFRALTLIGLVIASMIFGCYGEMYDTKQFIYFQF